MIENKGRILVVESNSMIIDIIGQQALQSMGFQVRVISDINEAISDTLQSTPNLLIVDLNLPGLSGKDFLVALNSQRISSPVIVIAPKGMESDVLQAFRLGASDYLLWPFKEAELVNAVERVLRLNQVPVLPAKEKQPQATSPSASSRPQEQGDLLAVIKKIISATDQHQLFEKIVEGAIKMTLADLGWLLLKDGNTNNLILVAQYGLSSAFSASQLNQPWDDGISPLVATSGEPLSISGAPLKRFKISTYGQAVLIVPVRIQKQVLGLLVVMHKSAQAFSPKDQIQLEEVGEYATLALINTRQLYKDKQQIKSLELDKKIRTDLLKEVEQEIRPPLHQATGAIDHILEGLSENLSLEQQKPLISIQENLLLSSVIIESLAYSQQQIQAKSSAITNLIDAVHISIQHMEHPAQLNRVNLATDSSSQNIKVQTDSSQLIVVLDGLLTNAIRFSPSGSQINVHVEVRDHATAHLSVHDNGAGIDPNYLAQLFDKGAKIPNTPLHPFGGMGIKLYLIKEIITACDGKIWAESQAGRGTTIHLTFPMVR